MPQTTPLDLDSLRARFLGRDEGGSTPEGRGQGFFEAALSQVTTPIAVLKEHRHVWANEGYQGLLAPRGGPVVGRTLDELLEPASWTRWQQATATPGHMRAMDLSVRPVGEGATEVELSIRTFHQGATDYLVVTARDLAPLRQAESAFKRNELGWRSLFEASTVGVAILSPDRRILEVNQALLDLAGAPRESVIDREWTLWLAEADRTRAVAPDGSRIPLPQKVELSLCRPDGLVVPVRVGSHPIYTPEGEVQGYLALIHDLTELHAHQAREQLLLQAIEQSPASVVITGAEGTIEYVNQAFVDITGYAREEALGQNPRILKSGLHTPEFYRGMWRTLAEGRIWSGRICNTKKNGVRFWEEATISPIRKDGKLTHFLAVKENISDRLDLQYDNRRLATAIGQIAEGVMVLSESGRLIYANQSARAMLAPWLPQLVEGCRLVGLIPREQRRDLLQAIQVALLQRGTWEGRIQRTDELGTIHTLGGALSLTRDWDLGHPTVVAVFQDLTRELAAERQLIQVEKMNTLGALAGGVVHDLNNVLSAILSASELLEWTLPEDSTAHAKLQVIRQAVLRAKDINRRIQTFSRQEQETFIPFDLSRLVKEVCILLKTTLPPQITFTQAIETSLWTTGNPTQLHQVLMNLAVNSYQAMEGRAGTLEVALSELPSEGSGEPELQLVVADTGSGISPEVLAHVFEPYFTTKAEAGGTGLGLSVVQKILTAHGGSIHLQSSPGTGTRATLRLPRAGAGAPAPTTLPLQALAGLESVLLVGEDEVHLALMKQGLQRLGYAVSEFADAMLALEAVRRNPGAYDVVVTESAPRGLSGAALLGHLRALRPDLALVRIQDLGMSPEPEVAPEDADALLTRPVGLQDLARAIREVAPRLRTVTVPETPESPRSRPLRVLLAEDSASTRALLRNWLLRLGCEVVEARDGALAWELFTQREVDFVLTDIVMPRMDGLQLVQRIRTSNPDLPVAILTSLEDHGAAKSALNLGVDEFLSKPFSQADLVACVDRLTGRLRRQRRAQESQDTAKEVRRAQQALVVTPEPDVPIFTVHHALTDAGGDLFKWFRRPDGSLFFVLGDVMGHSVMSSYAVAAFLGMLSSLAPVATDLHDLALRLNQGVKEGPFPDIPVCALLGHWDLRRGRVHLLNAGIPHVLLADAEQERGITLPINGTPLGFFDAPVIEEKVVWLREGDRLLLSTDGVLEAQDGEGRRFEDKALQVWRGLGGTPVAQALEIFCTAAQLHARDGIQDDVMVVAFEQGPADPGGTWLWVPSEMGAVDRVIGTLEGVLDRHDRSIPLTRSQRFNIVTATREALINAVSHGNQDRPELQVFFQAAWSQDPPRLQILVADEGLGFEAPAEPAIPDPLATRGRGLPFITTYAATTAMVGGELTLTFAWEA